MLRTIKGRMMVKNASNVALDIYFTNNLIKNTQLMHHIRNITILKNTWASWVSCVQSAHSRFYSGLCGFLWSWRPKIWFFTQPEYNDAIVAKENYLLTGGNLEQHSTCCLTWLFFKLAPLWCYCIRHSDCLNIPEIIYHCNSYKWLTACINRLPMDLDGKNNYYCLMKVCVYNYYDFL